MKHLSRVVWNEGMYLAQHHFQVQSRYFEDSLRFALAHLFFKSYGVAGCELDRDALMNGTVALRYSPRVLTPCTQKPCCSSLLRFCDSPQANTAPS